MRRTRSSLASWATSGRGHATVLDHRSSISANGSSGLLSGRLRPCSLLVCASRAQLGHCCVRAQALPRDDQCKAHIPARAEARCTPPIRVLAQVVQSRCSRGQGPATVQTLSPKDQELGRAGQWGKRGISGMGTERAGTWIVELHWLPLTLRLALVGCEVHVDCGRVFGDEAVRRPAVPLL
jgi:hypothetical protein